MSPKKPIRFVHIDKESKVILKGQKHNDSDMRRLQRVAHPNVNKIENYEKYLKMRF